MTGEPLTADETRALQYAADGHTETAAAHLYGTSQRSYRRIMFSARAKLGAVNVTHAVAIAATLRLIGAGTLPPPDATLRAAIEKLSARHQPKTAWQIVRCPAHSPFGQDVRLFRNCPDCREEPVTVCSNLTCCTWPCEDRRAIDAALGAT